MPTRSRPRLLLAGLAAAVLVLGLAGCGDDDEPAATGEGGTTTSEGGSTGGIDYGSTTGGGTGGEASPGTVVAADFSLTDVTVAPGEGIVLQNDGDQAHTATSDEDGLFDLEADPGETSGPGTAPMEPGAYAFHCEIHPNMTATLTVEE
jgi:plastocyanin